MPHRRDDGVVRMLTVDERGIGMRASWHPERGILNVSLWREDTCVETFHLTRGEAAKLIGFIAEGLADSAEL